MRPDSVALEDALSSLDVHLGQTRRVGLSPGGTVELERGRTVLGYIAHGEVRADIRGHTACAVDVSAGAATPTAPGRTLMAGDAFLSLGCDALTLRAAGASRLASADIRFTPPAGLPTLPPVVYVPGFVRLEPAAAALAAHLGPREQYLPTPQAGDPIICRLMVTTVLLSVIRAWAQSVDAPGAGLAPSGDAFLDRVVAAVRDDPGHDWTVDRLAVVGAMSRTVLSERFRAAFGRTPAGYVTEVRIRRAMDLLQLGHSVSETSRALGYASDEGFSRAFRRHVGQAPSSWRDERRRVPTA